jgi:osmotically-inducible protein OsmY
MSLRRLKWLCLLLACTALTGCVGGFFTGATLVYDRHSIYKKAGDFQLSANAGRAIYKDPTFKCKCCVIDIAVFNGDILIAGHVPSRALRTEIEKRISNLSGYRRVFIQVAVEKKLSNAIEDSWITTKIRSGILADSSIDPKAFKIVTADSIVYLMGDVMPAQAKKVIYIARTTTGVRRVVKLLKYYRLSEINNK